MNDRYLKGLLPGLVLLTLFACGAPDAEEAKKKLKSQQVPPTEESLIDKTKASNGEVSARMLVEAGVNPNARQANGMTVLMSAVFNGQEEVAKALLEKGADVNASAQGFTALSLAVEKNNPSLIKLLLAHGAKPDVRPEGGPSAIDKAQNQGKLDLLPLLTEGKKP